MFHQSAPIQWERPNSATMRNKNKVILYVMEDKFYEVITLECYALSVRCPTCERGAGEFCRDPNKNLMSECHLERFVAAQVRIPIHKFLFKGNSVTLEPGALEIGILLS